MLDGERWGWEDLDIKKGGVWRELGLMALRTLRLRRCALSRTSDIHQGIKQESTIYLIQDQCTLRLLV
jgi:hypothetical protein